MSSKRPVAHLSGNLVRVSGAGYRENIELKNARQPGEAAFAIKTIDRFGAGMTLSRLSDLSAGKLRLTPSADILCAVASPPAIEPGRHSGPDHDL